MIEQIKEQLTLPVQLQKEYDTVVIGGGLAGCAAAMAAGRLGVRVMLIEQSGILGGQATQGLVTPLSAVCSVSGVPFGGLVKEITTELRELGQTYCAENDAREVMPEAAPHVLKYLLLRKCVEAGVDVWFHTTLLDAEKRDGSITRVFLSTKSGICAVYARTYIDASGDADLAAKSGTPVTLGSEPGVYEQLTQTGLNKIHFSQNTKVDYSETPVMQPVSIFFIVGGVDIPLVQTYNNVDYHWGAFGITEEQFRAWQFANTPGFEENGDMLPMPQGRILISPSPRRDAAVVNMTRVTGIDATDAESLNKGERIAQMQVIAMFDFLKRFVPGFEHSYLIQSASTLGVRETRRLKGRYVLTGLDAIQCVTFPNCIAKGSYIIDIHDPLGKHKAIGGRLKGDCYDIPYDCLVSEETQNLLCCGRCISADHVAHSSTRIQGTCIQTGEAAGTAAALSVRQGITPCRLPAEKVQAVLGWLIPANLNGNGESETHG